MLAEYFPRYHARYTSLRLLGPHLDGFARWLRSQGYSWLPIRLRIRAAKRLDVMLRRHGVHHFEVLTATDLLAYAPKDSQENVVLSAGVRSLVRYLDTRGLLVRPAATPREQLVAAYRTDLERVRGLAKSTLKQHAATALEFLKFVGFDSDPTLVRRLNPPQVEEFIRVTGARIGRASLQHTVAHLRSFLRFLASRDEIARGLDFSIDTPRVYRGERLPRSLPWDTVQAFLAAIDRTTPVGRRDYAMFMLVTTYGLRTSEVSALRLDDISWRVGQIRVPRPKTKTPLVLPLTDTVAASLIDYVRHARPDLACREVFLRVRAPAGPLAPTAVTEAFQAWTRRGALPIPYQGPHCLRHSLAIHLLRQGASLKAIGDLLGHRSVESTSVYLRMQVADLRDAALDLPAEVRS